MVVDGSTTPLEPTMIVSPPTTTVVGVAPAPIAYFVPDMYTSPGSTENTSPPAETADQVGSGVPSGITVLDGRTSPLGPAVMVWPPMTRVVSVAPGPIWSVVPEMMASVEPISKVRPAAVTAEKVGAGGGVVGDRGRMAVLPEATIDEG